MSTTSTSTRGSSSHDAEEYAAHWHWEGASKPTIRKRLRNLGFAADEIDAAVKAQDAEPGGAPESKPAAVKPAPAKSAGLPKRASLPKRAKYAGFRDDAPEPAHSEGSGPTLVPGTPAGMILAVIAYPAVLAFLFHGNAGLKAWFLAKFFNRTPNDLGGTQTSAFTPLFTVPATTGGQPTATTTAFHSPTAPAAKAPVIPAGGKGAAAATWALSQLGKPYKWGGVGPNGFDCSGLTQKAWASVGVKIPRTTWTQIATGTRVAKANLQPGDLVFPFKGHVQMFIGNGQIVEAAHPGTNVRTGKLGAVLTARRPG